MAQIYPDKLCRQICRGIQEQVQRYRDGQFRLANISTTGDETNKRLVRVTKELQDKCQTVEEDDEEMLGEAWDDVSGASLDPKEVKGARKEEIDYVHKMGLYTKVPIQEAYEQTGNGPISVRRIDINKGDSIAQNYRSRLVAREINTSKRDDLFAATPPLEALKTTLAITTSGNKGEMLMVNDISRAFFHAPAKRKVYVQLPNEDGGDGTQKLCDRLNISMYGTRDAAQNWSTEYSR